jgi:hypothetical protein
MAEVGNAEWAKDKQEALKAWSESMLQQSQLTGAGAHPQTQYSTAPTVPFMDNLRSHLQSIRDNINSETKKLECLEHLESLLLLHPDIADALQDSCKYQY